MRWWKGRRKPDEDVVDSDSAVDVIELRATALEEWQGSADLVDYPSDLQVWCADRGRGSGEPEHLSAKKPQITVQPRGGNDQWAVQEIGAERAEKLYDLKGDAVAHALAEAKAAGADLVVEDDQGRIELWERHDAQPEG